MIKEKDDMITKFKEINEKYDINDIKVDVENQKEDRL